MRIWRAYELGEPVDVMKLDDSDPPTAHPNEIVIDVHAVGLNFPDILQCRGGYQVKPALPFAVGSEIAGVVTELGEGVRGISLGDRVAGSAAGGLAERAVMRADKALPLSATIPAAKAAALISNYTTTYYALHDRARIQAGETLLVHAGAGGIGSSAIQLGLAAGARVFATAGGAEKVQICKELGAELVIDYNTEDLVETIREATDNTGVDVVYDPVGGDVFDQSRRVVGWNGRYLVIGFTSGRIPEAPANHILLKNYSIVGVHWGAAVAREPTAMPRTFAKLVDLYDQGRIDPLIFREPFPLAEAANALTMLGDRQTWGKVIIDPAR
jgi:NADPH2:quinone reductase